MAIIRTSKQNIRWSFFIVKLYSTAQMRTSVFFFFLGWFQMQPHSENTISFAMFLLISPPNLKQRKNLIHYFEIFCRVFMWPKWSDGISITIKYSVNLQKALESLVAQDPRLSLTLISWRMFLSFTHFRH